MKTRLSLLLAVLTATALVPAAAHELPATPSPSPRLADLASPTGGASERKVTPIGQYGATRVMQLQLKAGTAMPAHSAPERMLVVVLAGRGSFGFGTEQVALHERQVLHMAPGEEHSVKAETDLDLLLVRIDEAASD
ncbi:MAG: cupin domain-containing protein [Stenotrophomonas sp.]